MSEKMMSIASGRYVEMNQRINARKSQKMMISPLKRLSAILSHFSICTICSSRNEKERPQNGSQTMFFSSIHFLEIQKDNINSAVLSASQFLSHNPPSRSASQG